MQRAVLLFAVALLATIPSDFHVRVEWSRGGRMVSAEVYGSGAAIWNDERASRMTPADVGEIVHAIRDAHFEAMPAQFGEEESDFLTMRGKVTAGDKTVVQLERGDQSDALATLATAILARVEAAARNGVVAESLEDGLAKIRSGAIPPEALRITAQQRGENGFLLQVRGGEATARRFDPKNGYGPPRHMRIDARTLAHSFPRGVYAPVYTELRVEVLGRSEERIARPETKGERFDIEPWRAAAERTLREGK